MWTSAPLSALARVPRGEAARSPSCPSRGRRYEPLRKQGPFEGSFRQRHAGDSDARALVAAARADRRSSTRRPGRPFLRATGSSASRRTVVAPGRDHQRVC